MAVALADTKKHYAQDKNLQEKSVDQVVEWVKCQPHLPNINEIQAILFLQKVNYKIDDAKKAIDAYFTFKTYFSHIFLGRNPLSPSLQKAFDVYLLTILPNKTPEGYSVYLIKPMDSNVTNYHLHREGASNGYIIIVDLKGLPYEFLPQLTPATLRPCFYDVEEVIPWKIKSFHLFNAVPFVSQIVALITPFFGENIAANFHVHNTVDELVKYIPRKCLPQDYGGSLESASNLHERSKKDLIEKAAFFEWEDQQTVDESNRIEVKNGSPFGESVSFKNWEMD